MSSRNVTRSEINATLIGDEEEEVRLFMVEVHNCTEHASQSRLGKVTLVQRHLFMYALSAIFSIITCTSLTERSDLTNAKGKICQKCLYEAEAESGPNRHENASRYLWSLGLFQSVP